MCAKFGFPDILALGHGLSVTEDEDPDKVQVSGMPLIATDEGKALTIANDLCREIEGDAAVSSGPAICGSVRPG